MLKLNTPFGRILQVVDPSQSQTSPQGTSFSNTAIESQPKPFAEIQHGDPRNTMSRLLNVGCGYDKRPGYLNIDMDPACKPDVLIGPANAGDLPSNYFEKVLAKDVLEHIPRTQTLAALLQWAQYLKIGGRLELQTSSVYGIVDMMRKQETFEYHYGMTVCMFGSQAHAGDFHYTGFTEQTLRVHLISAGFMPVSIQILDDWLFHVQAFKFEDWTQAPATNDPIKQLCNDALGRDPLPEYYDIYADTSYLDMARAIYSSSERLYYVATQFGI